MEAFMADEPGPSTARTQSRGRGAWPLILILVGVVLILGNLGWLDWNFLWGLTYLWPLLLIAVGADLLLRGRYRLVVFGLTLLVGAAVYVAYPRGPLTAGPPGETVSISRALDGARQAEVTLRSGVASLEIASARAAELLAEGAIETAMGERIEQRFEVRGGVATFVLESERPVGGIPVATRGGRWDLTLSGRVPMALTVDTGVGQATLDLSELALTRLDLDTGVGASTVTLPARGEYEVDIDTGIGAATVLLPTGLAARLTVSRGIGSISVPDGLVRNEDVYESPDYQTATDRVDIRLDSGLGAVNVERVR